jgi:hypothetical protein
MNTEVKREREAASDVAIDQEVSAPGAKRVKVNDNAIVTNTEPNEITINSIYTIFCTFAKLGQNGAETRLDTELSLTIPPTTTFQQLIAFIEKEEGYNIVSVSPHKTWQTYLRREQLVVSTAQPTSLAFTEHPNCIFHFRVTTEKLKTMHVRYNNYGGKCTLEVLKDMTRGEIVKKAQRMGRLFNVRSTAKFYSIESGLSDDMTIVPTGNFIQIVDPFLVIIEAADDGGLFQSTVETCALESFFSLSFRLAKMGTVAGKMVQDAQVGGGGGGEEERKENNLPTQMAMVSVIKMPTPTYYRPMVEPHQHSLSPICSLQANEKYSVVLRPTFVVYYKDLRGHSKNVHVLETDMVENLRLLIADCEGMPVDDIRLVFAGKQIEDGRLLSFYKIQKESTIHLLTRLRGD